MATSQLPKMIGATVKRKEDPRLMSGEGKFTEDVQLRGMVYMAVLRSPHAHARIRRLDLSRARQQPEVLAAMTGAEVVERGVSQMPLAGVREAIKARSRLPLAVDKALYVGDPVAALVATSQEAARDALDLIEVEYEALLPAVDLEEATRGGSPLVYDDMGTNLSVDASGRRGDPDAAFREADGVVSARLKQPRIVLNPIEPRSVVASYERGTGNLTVWDATQEPHKERDELAEVLGLPETKIRVIAIDVGGGFGCKISTYLESYLAAIFSMDLARPVRWVERREDHFISTTQGRGEVQYVDAAYKKDGTLLGLRIRYYTDLGAYSHGSSHSIVDMLTPLGAPGPYKVKNLAWTTQGVYTNKVPIGPYRGYGRHSTTYLHERIMDMIARELDMDPADVRRKNFVSRDEFPYRTPTGLEYDSGDYEAALDRALEIAGYDQLKEDRRRLRESGVLMGIGIACSVDTSGFGPTGRLSSRPGYESATLRVDPTGKVTVLTGSSSHGQAHETTFAQIVADELGVPVEDVDIVHGDTAIVPHGQGTYGSRSIVVGGTAVVKAGERVKEKAHEIASALLRTDPEHVMLEGGRFFAEDIPDRYVTWAEVGKEAYQVRHMPRDMERGLEATAYWEPLDYTYPYGANVAVVEIDSDTGDVKLTRYVVVNPMVVDGQTHGGLAQGIGAALLEEARWDENGQVITGSFMDYAMPLADELPMFSLDRTETPTPHNPLGVKGAGEMGAAISPPAIVNAVVDALSHLGVTHIDMPVTSEKVWRVLKEKGVTGA